MTIDNLKLHFVLLPICISQNTTQIPPSLSNLFFLTHPHPNTHTHINKAPNVESQFIALFVTLGITCFLFAN